MLLNLLNEFIAMHSLLFYAYALFTKVFRLRFEIFHLYLHLLSQNLIAYRFNCCLKKTINHSMPKTQKQFKFNSGTVATFWPRGIIAAFPLNESDNIYLGLGLTILVERQICLIYKQRTRFMCHVNMGLGHLLENSNIFTCILII